MAKIDEEQFDRSIRLWGMEGQRALSAAHVLLLGATATGSEALKHLVLPGLGALTVVDDRCVTAQDLGCNFFLEQADLGLPRAPAVLRNILEMNPDARGNALQVSPSDVIRAAEGEPYSLQSLKVTLVLASSCVEHRDLLHLSALCCRLGTPLLFLDAIGIFGVLRVQAPDQFVIYTHPDPEVIVYDIPVLEPFPELEAWYEAHDPTDTNKFHDNHSHIPWPCILFHAMRNVLRETNNTQFTKDLWPKVRTAITEMTRVDPFTNLKKEENMAEARDRCNMSTFASARERPQLRAVLGDVRCAQPSKTDHSFWFIANGVKRFSDERQGQLPQPGVLPDFRCATTWYRELQDIFKMKALADSKIVFEHAKKALLAAGRSENDVTFDDVCDFCAHVYDAALVSFVPIEKEFSAESMGVNPLRLYASSPDSFILWYAVYRATRLFAEKYGRYPGARPDNDEASLATEADLLATLLTENDPLTAQNKALKSEDLHAVVREMVRYGGSELCAPASVVGAVAAQEAIKLIQRRRIPLFDAIVFDGNLGVFGTVCVA